ncbi:serine hydrolase domain-containing protein [Alloacidobacterium sp.]|uniref:serine hydrolase domain-containing protein n=1 Tax=Alloacidobacterium sp. TaxID=2951999 RepID=UPI002D308453|nr:serine hydrolase domain-containing protein [Alloacidobacterium sp.]HYK35273.1 serine hydrolase domain-containing protein [Alloacidobacterium sp.]
MTLPFANSNQRTRFGVARTVLQQAVNDHVFPGAAYGVLLDGQIVALDAVGHFTYDDVSAEVMPETIFDLASITKVMATTAMAMLLFDRGILDLDAPLGEMLPGFVIGSAAGSGREHVTMRMLLAHSSGLPAYARLFEQHTSASGLLRACLQMPLEATPGMRAEYSDIGFILLGKALEVLAGDHLAQFCQREIFAPLELTSACFCPSASSRPQLPPTENDTTFRKRVLQGEVHDENAFVLGGCGGHAGLFANALDVLRFASCILAEGWTARGEQLFQPTTVQLFATRQSTPPGASRALGWDTPTVPSSSGKNFSASSIGHLGYTGTSLWIDRDRNLAVVLLTNRTWPDRSNKAIQRVRPAFHDAIFNGL